MSLDKILIYFRIYFSVWPSVCVSLCLRAIRHIDHTNSQIHYVINVYIWLDDSKILFRKNILRVLKFFIEARDLLITN